MILQFSKEIVYAQCGNVRDYTWKLNSYKKLCKYKIVQTEYFEIFIYEGDGRQLNMQYVSSVTRIHLYVSKYTTEILTS